MVENLEKKMGKSEFDQERHMGQGAKIGVHSPSPFFEI